MNHEDHNPVPVDELLDRRVAFSLRRHEPVGVVTCITPYNAASMMAFRKVIPALMAGTSVFELGGKSAHIYLPDAMHRAGIGAAMVVAMTVGQACVLGTRMLVPNHKKDEALETATSVYSHLKVGPPMREGTRVGPLISATARERCEHYVALTAKHGREIVTGGGRPEGLDKAYYFEPTILDLPDSSSPAAQDETFGPMLGVIGYRDIDPAVQMAKDSSYGPSGQAYGNSTAEAPPSSGGRAPVP